MKQLRSEGQHSLSARELRATIKQGDGVVDLTGVGTGVEIAEAVVVELQASKKVRTVFDAVIQTIGVGSVPRRTVCVLGAEHQVTLRRRVTARLMGQLEVENLGVEGAVVVLVEVEEEEGVEDRPDIVRVRMRRMRKRSRGMRRC